MGAIVNLQSDTLSVDPGRSVTTELSLVNSGTIVEQFTIMLLGDVVEWADSDPPVVSLFPGAQQSVTLRFSPPRAYTTPNGPVPFGVKVIPSNEPEESVTEEGVLTIGSFTDVGAELVPRVATGRLAAHQKLAVDSRGNVPLTVGLAAIDAADALKFRFRPQKLTSAPGEARYVRIRIRPRQRFWRGSPQQKPYQVQVAPENENPLVLEGALTQKPILPKWFLPALGILAALLLLWFLVLRPIVHNDAVNANKAALAAQQAQTRALANQVATASQQAQTATAAAAAAAALAKHKPVPATTTTSTTTTTTVVKAIVKTAKPTTTVASTTTTTVLGAPPPATTAPPTTPTTQPPPVTGPNDGRIEVIAAPGSTASNSITIAAQSTLQVTDLIIQNVSGQAGQARIQRTLGGPTPPPAQSLLVENLGPLTDQEYQFSTPMVFTSGQKMTLSVDCQSELTCDVGVYYTGPLTQPVTDTTTTFPG
jgi:hypothetical protein